MKFKREIFKECSQLVIPLNNEHHEINKSKNIDLITLPNLLVIRQLFCLMSHKNIDVWMLFVYCILCNFSEMIKISKNFY